MESRGAVLMKTAEEREAHRRETIARWRVDEQVAASRAWAERRDTDDGGMLWAFLHTLSTSDELNGILYDMGERP